MKYLVKPIVDGDCIGEAVVIDDWISFFGEIDPNRGIHVVSGKEIVDKVLVFRGGRGSTVGSYIIYALKKNNLHPRCMIVGYAEPIIIVGAVLADIPLLIVDDFEDFISSIKDGVSIYYRRGYGYLVVNYE